MTGAVRAGIFLVMLAAAGGWAQGQQSNGAATTHNSGKQRAGAVKQEFGPQSMPRRGDRMTTATPTGQAAGQGAPQATATAPSTGTGQAEVKTEKFHVRQDFGPQTMARRGDRTAAAGAGDQGGKQGISPAGTQSRQEFGPAQGTKHRDGTERRKARSQSKQQN